MKKKTELAIDEDLLNYAKTVADENGIALEKFVEEIIYEQIGAEILETSANLRSQTGFLVNDSVSLAMMERQGIRAIAANDMDFQPCYALEVHVPDAL